MWSGFFYIKINFSPLLEIQHDFCRFPLCYWYTWFMIFRLCEVVGADVVGKWSQFFFKIKNSCFASLGKSTLHLPLPFERAHVRLGLGWPFMLLVVFLSLSK